MNNSTGNSTQFESDIGLHLVIIGFYLQTVMIYAGAVLNFICILIFIIIIRNEQYDQGNLFKYLLVKSVFDFLFFLQNIPQMFYYRVDFSVNDSYGMQYWFIYCFYFLYPLTSQLSVWFEIAASIDCLCLVARKFQWHKTTRCFWKVTLSMIGISIIYYSPLLFWYKIEKNESGNGYRPVIKHINEFLFLLFYYLSFIHIIFRDVLPLFVSIILNLMILFYIRRLTIAHKNMNSSVINNTSIMVKRLQKVERNNMKMMLFTSFIHVFHIPVIIYNLNAFNVKSKHFLSMLCILSINFSYFIPIISYIKFNTTFRRYISIMLGYK
jgi:hypothetical protein